MNECEKYYRAFTIKERMNFALVCMVFGEFHLNEKGTPSKHINSWQIVYPMNGWNLYEIFRAKAVLRDQVHTVFVITLGWEFFDTVTVNGKF